MTFEDAQRAVYKLTESLKEELDYSEYIVYEDLELPYDPDPYKSERTRIAMSTCSIPDDYQDHLLSIGDNLIKVLSFANIRNDVKKNALTKWVISRISNYKSNDCNWKNETGKPLPLNIEEKFKNVDIPLFEAAKKAAHYSIIADLKELLTDPTIVDFTKIVWNGQQKELAKLFAVLINKKWIGRPSNFSEFAKTLNGIFDFPNTSHRGSKDKSENLRTELFSHPKYGFKCLTEETPFDNILNTYKSL